MILPDRIEHPAGGMGVQAKYLIQHLEQDFELSVHGFPDNTALPYYHGVPNLLSKIRHGGLNTLTCQAAYLASVMEDAERGFRPDLIHVADYTEYLAGIYAARIFKVPLVVSMQLSAHLMHEMNLWSAREPRSPDGIAIENSMKEMELLGLREAAQIIHVSSEYKKIFSTLPGLDQKSTYIPNGVELKEFDTFKKISLPGKNRLKVVFLGRFALQKNIGALIQAKIPAGIDLIFAGERESGPHEIFAAIIRKSQSEPNVHYFGPAYGQEKVNLLRSADAVIIPSLHECHPLVMHEAMAGGNIVLHSGAGDMKNILTPDFTINSGTTPESISRAFEIFAAMSEEEIVKRKAHGMEIVKEYSWAKAAEKTKEVFLSALKKAI